MTAVELELLRSAAADRASHLQIVVTGCAFSCCGRGWYRRDGYEQIYRGWIDNLSEPRISRDVSAADGTFMLYSPGLGGGLSYVVAVRFSEVSMIERLEPNA